MSENSTNRQLYMVNGYDMVIEYDVVGNDNLVVMAREDGYGDYVIQRKDSLVKKEDSWEYKQAKKRADEIRLITQKVQDNLDAVADRVVDKALKNLAERIKFNVAFGEGGSAGAYALMLSSFLEEMIKESGEKIKSNSSTWLK